MARRTMQRFARWHVWLGWLVGLPMLMWAVTGLFMVARPIEEVRGEHLRAEPAAIDPAGVAFPAAIGEPVREARLVAQPGGPAWIVTSADGARWRYSAVTGAALAPVVRREAQAIATAAYAGDARLEALTYFPAGAAPAEARTSGAAWRGRFSDDTHVYIDDATGEVLALRTGQWRLYDVMWGLHIMDLKTREDSHHPVIVVFAALAAIGAALGCVLLFRRRRSRLRS
jgi:hypothetical protein